MVRWILWSQNGCKMGCWRRFYWPHLDHNDYVSDDYRFDSRVKQWICWHAKWVYWRHFITVFNGLSNLYRRPKWLFLKLLPDETIRYVNDRSAFGLIKSQLNLARFYLDLTKTIFSLRKRTGSKTPQKSKTMTYCTYVLLYQHIQRHHPNSTRL